ncbi:hypothetical protein GHT06_020732 [Daphnia sinensis]|uniref:Uncharacterized protein n=1 Tax=Daphnia sinensis TaxID=1820382 RepID=A0AAD5KIT9_9CRUS|nr:hypothetical protein GHT06_020732 [Daphnia sinensis]
MAIQNNIAVSMLVLAVCLASAIASTPTRDPKELLIFPHSYSPFYRVPSMQSRYGPTQRQTNSPINPMIGQQGLGPFFGYFPNLLTQPCPACPDCEICPACEVCPVVPEMPPPGEITTCGENYEAPMSASLNGTIKLNIAPTGTSNAKICQVGLTAFYPNTKVKINCGTLGSGVTLNAAPLSQPVTVAEANKDYLSKDNFLFVIFNNGASPSSTIAAECTWTNVPA